jgi:hypothetical protein
MPYVTNTLEDEDKEKQAPEEKPPLIGGQSAPASSGGGSVGGDTQPQHNPAQKGSGFVNLQSWLDAGQGRDKAVSDKGASALQKESDSWTGAKTTAEEGLGKAQPVTLGGSVSAALDREIGASATPPPRTGHTPNRRDEPVPGVSVAPTGPTIGDVLDQKYTGPETIGYKPGQDLTDLALLSGTNTIADVTGREAAEAGQYGKFSGLRALDDVLYGADAASVNAAGANKASGKKFVDGVTAGMDTFNEQVAARKGAIDTEKGRVRDELKKIYGDQMKDIQGRVDLENEQALADSHNPNQVRVPTSGRGPGASTRMIGVPGGQVMGEWEGSEAGSATVGNMMRDDEAKRFGALSKYLGYDNAPTDTGDYARGRWTTKDAPPAALNVQSSEADALDKFSAWLGGEKPDPSNAGDMALFDALNTSPTATGLSVANAFLGGALTPGTAIAASGAQSEQANAIKTRFIEQYGPEAWRANIKRLKAEGKYVPKEWE